MNDQIISELKKIASVEKQNVLQKFFKTRKGEYGEGDIFLGVMVPQIKKLAKKYYKEITLNETKKLLHNKYHEVRQTALFILRFKYDSSNINNKEKIYNLYLDNTKYINNWDLVDSFAHYIVGDYIYQNNLDRKVLYDLVESDDLWKQRIAILSTFYFIKNNDFGDIIKISNILINHKHDLIQKASGWMLREVGKRDYKVLYNFLKENHEIMPRTMLRYSIEKLSEEDKKLFMSK